MSTPIPGCTCTSCGYEFEVATASPGSQAPAPQDGAVSICIQCGQVDLFTATDGNTLSVRRPTDAERAELLAQPAIANIVGAIILRNATEGLTR